jgi:hypothetical protein
LELISYFVSYFEPENEIIYFKELDGDAFWVQTPQFGSKSVELKKKIFILERERDGHCKAINGCDNVDGKQVTLMKTMNPAFLIAPTVDTCVNFTSEMFVDRRFVREIDCHHNGFCGYEAVGRDLNMDPIEVCQALYDFASTTAGGSHSSAVVNAEAKKRYKYVHTMVKSRSRSLERKGWMNTFEDLPLLSNILKRPILLWKRETSLTGYTVSAVYIPDNSGYHGAEATSIFLKEIYFGSLRFVDSKTKTAVEQRAIKHFLSGQVKTVFPTVDLTAWECAEAEEIVQPQEASPAVKSTGGNTTVTHNNNTYEYVGVSILEHKIVEKVHFFDQVSSKKAIVKSGDEVVLKGKTSHCGRFFVIGGVYCHLLK